MEQCDVTGLSPRKVAYLKYLYDREGTARTGEIATHFTIDPSTATKAVRELSAAGLVDHRPYSGVRLTEKGQECAEFLVRRHRILGLILAHYGLEGEEACREAERFESYVTSDAINKMCESMGHPTRGICGTISHGRGCGIDDQ
ncbi:MAG TPA: metal-dependent transcriptional regulator [Methanolinea sp.]|nr:metal-dependent transcriptional regulator [Methanolinea sp.]HQK56459.1 metal-dependent transcriptional regulator [Methanolinea sp.]